MQGLSNVRARHAPRKVKSGSKLHVGAASAYFTGAVANASSANTLDFDSLFSRDLCGKTPGKAEHRTSTSARTSLRRQAVSPMASTRAGALTVRTPTKRLQGCDRRPSLSIV